MTHTLSLSLSQLAFADSTCIDCDTCRWMVPVSSFFFETCEKVRTCGWSFGGTMKSDEQCHGLVMI